MTRTNPSLTAFLAKTAAIAAYAEKARDAIQRADRTSAPTDRVMHAYDMVDYLEAMSIKFAAKQHGMKNLSAALNALDDIADAVDRARVDYRSPPKPDPSYRAHRWGGGSRR